VTSGIKRIQQILICIVGDRFFKGSAFGARAISFWGEDDQLLGEGRSFLVRERSLFSTGRSLFFEGAIALERGAIAYTENCSELMP